MIVTIGRKRLYNTDDSLAASEWVRQEIKGIKTVSDTFQLTNAIGVKTKGGMRGCMIADTGIGYFGNNSNNVYNSLQFVSLMSWAFSRGNGLPIVPANLRKVCALFTARKTIKKSWINDTLEYMAPTATG